MLIVRRERGIAIIASVESGRLMYFSSITPRDVSFRTVSTMQRQISVTSSALVDWA